MDEKILPVGNKGMIMSDRELLELAAKAAGLLTTTWDGNHAYIDGMLSQWNPLADDGDAFRLLIDLNLDLTFDIIEGEIFVCEPFGDYWSEYLGDNPRAAARRVIVRAAAEMGRAMPQQSHSTEFSGLSDAATCYDQLTLAGE